MADYNQDLLGDELFDWIPVRKTTTKAPPVVGDLAVYRAPDQGGELYTVLNNLSEYAYLRNARRYLMLGYRLEFRPVDGSAARPVTKEDVQ